ncbi:MAG: hypothetical protein JXB14_01950 [Candidatus Altiarchaeota archaeon]|nr:hypothetical protein [Candidatus Altiarchaeota archaeon]
MPAVRTVKNARRAFLHWHMPMGKLVEQELLLVPGGPERVIGHKTEYPVVRAVRAPFSEIGLYPLRSVSLKLDEDGKRIFIKAANDSSYSSVLRPAAFPHMENLQELDHKNWVELERGSHILLDKPRNVLRTIKGSKSKLGVLRFNTEKGVWENTLRADIEGHKHKFLYHVPSFMVEMSNK